MTLHSLLLRGKQALLGSFSRSTRDGGGEKAAYLDKVREEQANYAECANVHELPEIFHYWSNKYLLPKCQQCGFSSFDEFFANGLEKCLKASGRSEFASVGAGNCDTEVRVAALLKSRGYTQFSIECLDINPRMLERGAQFAKEMGVEDLVRFVEQDFNDWKPNKKYQAVMANQSLHHVVELENLFDAVAAAIGDDGRFIVSDMVGRNGHQRWPEALEIVHEYWRELPESYRYNQLLRRQEDIFQDWDCSVSGFEGIRAQDVLPLLIERFQFELFLPFANVIDPFIDRAFGHNFDAKSEWDRDLIDRIHARDESEMASGRIKPTHMVAVMGRQQQSNPYFLNGLSPAHCVRQP